MSVGVRAHVAQLRRGTQFPLKVQRLEEENDSLSADTVCWEEREGVCVCDTHTHTNPLTVLIGHDEAALREQ